MNQSAPPPEPQTKPILVQEPAIAFTSALTLAEFLAQMESRENRRCLRRQVESLALPPEQQRFCAEYPKWVFIIALVAENTPDTLTALPVLVRLAQAGPRLSLRILREEDDLGLLNELVDEDLDLEADLDEVDLPFFFFFDEEWTEQGRWGPRPQAAEERLDQWLAANPRYEALLADEEAGESEELTRLMAELTHRMRIWYNDDLTQAAAQEIQALLEQILGPTPEESDQE